MRDGEEIEADFLISACGVLHHPRYPDIAGLESFAGDVFHSARWDHSVPLEGRRIGMIGTGSTGVQITCALSQVAGRLEIFQRTAQWVFPGRNPELRALTRRVMRRFPALNRLSYRFWQKYFEHLIGRAVVQPGWQRRFVDALCRLQPRTVRDPLLRAKLTPDYDPMCKRLVVSANFYKAVQQPNVDVVHAAIDRVEPEGIVTRRRQAPSARRARARHRLRRPRVPAAHRADGPGRGHARRRVARRPARLPHGRGARASPTSSC